MQLSIFSSAELPASRSASQDSERAWMTRVATSRLPILPLLNAIAPAGWSGRTSPASCRVTADGILEPSSGGWQNSGMGGPTESLTLSTSESPSSAVESSLSDILEDGDIPPRFYLSARACQGYLRRLDRIRSQTPNGGLEKVEFLIASMRATAASGEAINGMPADTSSSDLTGARGEQPSLR